MDLTFHQIAFGIVYILSLGIVLYERDRWINFSEAKQLILRGLLLLLAAIVLNSLLESRWDVKYLLDFLMLKEVGRWIFLMMVGLAYILILPGLEISLIVMTKRARLKKWKIDVKK